MSSLGGKRGFLSSPATTFIASGDWRHQCPSGIHCWRQKTVTFCRLIAILRNNARTRAIETTDKIPFEISLTPLPLPLNSGCIAIFDKHDEIAQIWSLMQKDGEVIVGWNLIMLRVHWHFHRCYSSSCIPLYLDAIDSGPARSLLSHFSLLASVSVSLHRSIVASAWVSVSLALSSAYFW